MYRNFEYMQKRRNAFILISILSQPVMWALLQAYQNGAIRPLGQMLAAKTSLFATLAPSPGQAPLLASSLLSLVLFGVCALIWPDIGFGQVWKPSRSQGMVVLGIIAASVAYPVLNSLVGYKTPVGHMGFIIWTITPVQEEILFRGFLYTFTLHLFGRTENSSWRETLPVLIVGAAWFSLWHLTPYGIERYGWGVIGPQLLLTFGAGLLFNGLRYWTKSIWLIIPVHAAGNFMISIM